MDSREIVRRTLDFAGPERVAVSFGDPDLAWTGCSAATLATEWREAGGARWERTDEWGNTWARVDATSKGEVVRGVLDGEDGLDRVDELVLPDFSDPSGYERVRRDPRVGGEGRAVEPAADRAVAVADVLHRARQLEADRAARAAALHERPPFPSAVLQ